MPELPHNKARRLERRRALQQYVADLKADTPCFDCGESFHPAVMDFHHRDPEEKSFVLSDVRGRGYRSIKAEIEKCDCLCANCHRMRHVADGKYAQRAEPQLKLVA